MAPSSLASALASGLGRASSPPSARVKLQASKRVIIVVLSWNESVETVRFASPRSLLRFDSQSPELSCQRLRSSLGLVALLLSLVKLLLGLIALLGQFEIRGETPPIRA